MTTPISKEAVKSKKVHLDEMRHIYWVNGVPISQEMVEDLPHHPFGWKKQMVETKIKNLIK